MTGRCPECGHDPASDELERRCEQLMEENKRLREDTGVAHIRLVSLERLLNSLAGEHSDILARVRRLESLP